MVVFEAEDFDDLDEDYEPASDFDWDNFWWDDEADPKKLPPMETPQQRYEFFRWASPGGITTYRDGLDDGGEISFIEGRPFDMEYHGHLATICKLFNDVNMTLKLQIVEGDGNYDGRRCQVTIARGEPVQDPYNTDF